jgi:hypothetical protein
VWAGGQRDGGVGGFSEYFTQNAGRSACLPIVTVRFWCPGMSSNDGTIRLAAVFARSLPLMFASPHILCSIVGSPSIIIYWSVVTMAAIRGL